MIYKPSGALTMGEAARRKRMGMDARRVGEAVLAALNADAGGEVWGTTRRTSIPPMFLVLDPETDEVRPGSITNGQAAETPHRVVGIVLARRGESWIEAMVFDPGEEYRGQVYLELQTRALQIALPLMESEQLDSAYHEIITSTWASDRELQGDRLMEAFLAPVE
jgi:hypothetical protein